MTIEFFLDCIICFQTVQGDHRKLIIIVQKCNCYILQLFLLEFDWSHRYLYIFLIIYFSLINNSERYREIICNGSTPFWKLSALYWNYEYYGYIYITVFILITHYWVSILKYISSIKIRNNAVEAPFGIPGTSTEPKNNLRFKLLVERKI